MIGEEKFRSWKIEKFDPQKWPPFSPEIDLLHLFDNHFTLHTKWTCKKVLSWQPMHSWKKKERAWARALLILTRSNKDDCLLRSYTRRVIWNPCRKHNNLANRKSLQHLKSCLFATSMSYWNVYVPYIKLASFFEKSLCYENRGNIRTPRRRKLFVPIFNEITLEEKRPQKSFSHSKTSLKNYCFTELN